MDHLDRVFLTIILVGMLVAVVILGVKISKVETAVKELKARVVLVEDGVATYTVK